MDNIIYTKQIYCCKTYCMFRTKTDSKSKSENKRDKSMTKKLLEKDH